RPAAQPISTPAAAMMQPAPAPVAAPIAAPAPVSAQAPAPEPASAAIDYASAAAVLFAGSPVSWQPSPARVSPQSARTVEAAPTTPRNVTPALQREIRAARPVDTSISGVAKAGVMHELLSAGFSAHLARQVADEVCADDPDPTIEAVAESLERELWIAGADEIITRGGIYALVGPTGVGKTTTVAKLAARAVVRFGASKVALLTTDSYRVGAHDQLRIYGRILSVPVHAIRDARDLATALAEQKDRHIVLIDTIGMSQRDRMVAEQAAMLAGCGDVKRLLLLPTTANARTLEQVVSAYKKSGVDGCILTKTDEAGSIAPALDVIIRHQLPLHYVTDGQRVPEDLQLPDSVELVREALKSSDDEAFVLSQEEMPFMIPVDHARSTEEVAHG
ncbi:MAG TPA: flagellar biosynthesis protein FlhF, partial [Burkholderiales bacterium]|nr:flagellar biosynthesis protein FlhF [Burkholderiales bacterium]